MPSVIVELSDMTRRKGLKRMLAYVTEDNISSLKGFERAGFKKFEELRVIRFLFLAKEDVITQSAIQWQSL